MIPFATAFLAARSSQRVDPPVNVVAPTISGSAVVNATLQASTGTWLGSPTGYAYQWLRGGAEIAGATAASYKVATADIGYAISVRVVASNAGGPSAPAASISTAAVQDGAPVSTLPLPAITGTAGVGSTLSGTLGSWTNSPTAYSRQWLRGGAAIAGATGATYVLTASDAGYEISVRVTATNANGSATATSAPTAIVTRPAPANVDIPTVSGSAAVGNTLSVSTGSWTNSPTAYAYQWLRGGSAISGATGSTYAVTSADIGSTISCRVTATNSGGSASVVATAGTVSEPAPANTSLPTISGTASVGSVLTANRGSWTNSPTAYAYQWLRSGSAISGATGSTYTVTANDAGYKISVRVTATNAWGAGAATSAATASIPQPLSVPVNISAAYISGSSTVGGTMVANTGLWSNNPTSYRYQWWSMRQSRSVGTAASYNPVAADAGGDVILYVWAANAAGESESSGAYATVTSPLPVNTSKPAISGTMTVGSTLTASTGAWTGSPTSYSYRWFEGGEETVVLGTGKTYTLTPSDLYRTLQVSVRAHNAAGQSEWAWSTYTPSIQPAALPINTVAPLISGSPIAKIGATIQASTGTWQGSPTSYAYQWQYGLDSDNDPSGIAWSDASGQTSSSHVITGSAGTYRRVKVTATNANGSTVAYSGQIGPVYN